VEKGYSPKRHCRDSRHPLIAVGAEPKMVANALMRTRDHDSCTDFTEYYNELLTTILLDRIGFPLADSGFCNETLKSRLENE